MHSQIRLSILYSAFAIILYGCATAPEPSQPVETDDESRYEILRVSFQNGARLEGVARDDSENWPFVLQVVEFDEPTGMVEGRIEWLSLEAIHWIKGRLDEKEFSFEETDYIQEGAAILECSYRAPIRGPGDRLEGTWGGCKGYSGTGTFWMNME